MYAYFVTVYVVLCSPLMRGLELPKINLSVYIFLQLCFSVVEMK